MHQATTLNETIKPASSAGYQDIVKKNAGRGSKKINLVWIQMADLSGLQPAAFAGCWDIVKKNAGKGLN